MGRPPGVHTWAQIPPQAYLLSRISALRQCKSHAAWTACRTSELCDCGQHRGVFWRPGPKREREFAVKQHHSGPHRVHRGAPRNAPTERRRAYRGVVIVSASKPAVAGEILSLVATGLGPARASLNPGQPFPSSPLAGVNSPIEVTVNGESAEVLAAAGYPAAVDGYQVNFRVPADIAKGAASIQVTVAWITGTSVSICNSINHVLEMPCLSGLAIFVLNA
jgi:hypothetical protein